MTLEPRTRRYLAVAIGLIVAGVGLAIAGLDVAGFAVGGLGAVLLVAAAFYAVGRSEDLDSKAGGT